MSRGICKFCNEERELWLSNSMCYLCNEYLSRRAMRISRDVLIDTKVIEGNKE